MKTSEQLEAQVNEFNLLYKTGDMIKVEVNGKIEYCTVKAHASILGGHSAVGWFNEISGCYSLDKVQL